MQSRNDEFDALRAGRAILDKIIHTPFPEDFMDEWCRDQYFTFDNAFSDEVTKAGQHLRRIPMQGAPKAHRLTRAWVHALRAQVIVGAWTDGVSLFLSDADVIDAQDHLRTAWRLAAATFDQPLPPGATVTESPDALLARLRPITLDASFAHPKWDLYRFYNDVRRDVEHRSTLITRALTEDFDAAKAMYHRVCTHQRLTEELRLPQTLPGSVFVGRSDGERPHLIHLTLER